MSNKVIRISVLLCFFAAFTSHAQQKPPAGEDVVKVKSNLVNIDVIVKDKKGKYISDLKPPNSEFPDVFVQENG